MRVITTILVAITLVLSSFAQVASTNVYKIKPEDVLRIGVYNEPQGAVDVPVGADGNISAPYVGSLHVAGKTTDEVQRDLTILYKKNLKLRDPIVSVIIIKYRELRATIGGAIVRPGQYPIRPGDTLLDLLSLGGGQIQDVSDLRRATFHRAGSTELIPVDLYSMLVLGDRSQNYSVDDGDELNVPQETRNRILVQGAVSQPGAYPYREPMSLADAISQAHGELRTRSKLSEVYVFREKPGMPGNYTQIRCNFVRFIRNGDATQNIPLKPGDLVYVSETKTPDINQLSAILQTTLFFNNIYTNGIFGTKLH
jgi:polysaccharide biosynthesis/export protein